MSIIKADHWSPSVSFDFTLSECTAPLCSHRLAACNRQKFSDPDSVAYFDSLCDNFTLCPSSSIFSLCNDVTSQLRSAGLEAFPFSGPSPRDSWLSPHTWKLINSVKRIRRIRGNLGTRIKSLSLTSLFTSWYDCCHEPPSDRLSVCRPCGPILFLHQSFDTCPSGRRPNGLKPFFDIIHKHRTWYQVHSISLYALQYWASRNYYIDYRAHVEKIAIQISIRLFCIY